MPSRRLVVLGVATALVAAAGFSWWARRVPGAGALHQTAPEVVQAGAPFEIKVLAGVWGEGREPQARYRDWSLQLMQGGQALGPPVGPSETGREGERIWLRFRLSAPAGAGAPSAALTWQLRFVFDGSPQRVDGPHPITVRP